MPWTRQVFDIGQSRCDLTAFYETSEDETAYDVSISFVISGETALERFVGCTMIGLMPDDGLEEALHLLRDMFEFYSQRYLYWQSDERRKQLPQRVDADLVGERKRPDLVIS